MKSECCEEVVLRGIMQIWSLGGGEDFVSEWEEFVFDAFCSESTSRE